MKLFNRISAFTLLVFLIFLSNCSKEEFKSFEFQIYVDSIDLLDTIQVRDTLEIEFFGTIGTNGCFSFKRFDTEFFQNSVYVEAIGKASGAMICPAVMVYLDGTILRVDNLSEGEFIIRVGQPDDTELVATVIVE